MTTTPSDVFDEIAALLSNGERWDLTSDLPVALLGLDQAEFDGLAAHAGDLLSVRLAATLLSGRRATKARMDRLVRDFARELDTSHNSAFFAGLFTGALIARDHTTPERIDA